MRIWTRPHAFSALWMLSAAFCGLAAPRGVSAHEEKKPRVLYVTTCGGFNHEEARPISKIVIADIGKRSGVYETVYDKKMDPKYKADEEAIKLITPEGLKQFDAVFFYTTGGKNEFPLSEENRQALIDFVKGGKAFVGFHSATDTYADWEPYWDMIGGSFDGHPWNAGDEPVKLDVEDPSHPAAVHLGDSWTIQDEIYQFKNYSREKLHVILSMNAASVKEKGKRADGDYPIAWCKKHGEGRVFYTSLGHRKDVWTNPVFREHVLGGIRWALGLAPGDSTPGKPKPPSEWKPIFTDIAKCPRSGKSNWELVDGVLKGSGDAGHIFSEEKVRDFEFRTDVNISEGGNSGMYFRCQNQEVWPHGYEAQVNNSHGDPVRTGSLYGRDKIYERLVPPDQPWFKQHIIAVGNHIIIKVNGKIVVDRIDNDILDAGPFALQQHDPGSKVQYKNIEMRVLPPAKP